MGRKQSPEHVAEDGLARDGAKSTKEPRVEKVMLGRVIADNIRQTGRPHRLIPDRALDRLIHDLSVVAELPEHEISAAAASGSTTGERSQPTKEQVEVMQRYADGATVEEIAAERGVGTNAVRAMRERAIWNVAASGTGMPLVVAVAALVQAGLVRGRDLPVYLRKARKPGAKAKPIPIRKKGARVEVPRDARELTERELTVVQLICQGATDPEIADLLDLSVYTVRAHVKRLLHKTKARNRVQLAAMAVQGGWV